MDQLPGVSAYQSLLLLLTYIVLFLYGLKAFSKEIQELGAERMQQWLGRFTRKRWQAFGLGAVFTAVIQSSSAVSAMTVALVDAGAFSFASSLGVLLGANVGTTATAWLVSLKLTQIGPVFIVMGTLVSMLPHRIHLMGKTMFYFGFILFTLQLLSDTLKPLQENPQVVQWLQNAENPLWAVLVGMLLTVAVQSSSVVSGLAIILVQTNLVELPQAVGLIIGSNVGTTSTAFLASAGLNEAARLTALANFIFNLSGTLIFLPLIGLLSSLVRQLTPDPSFQVAFAHLIFNLSVALLFMSFLPSFGQWLIRISGRDQGMFGHTQINKSDAL